MADIASTDKSMNLDQSDAEGRTIIEEALLDDSDMSDEEEKDESSSNFLNETSSQSDKTQSDEETNLPTSIDKNLNEQLIDTHENINEPQKPGSHSSSPVHENEILSSSPASEHKSDHCSPKHESKSPSPMHDSKSPLSTHDSKSPSPMHDSKTSAPQSNNGSPAHQSENVPSTGSDSMPIHKVDNIPSKSLSPSSEIAEVHMEPTKEASDTPPLAGDGKSKDKPEDSDNITKDEDPSIQTTSLDSVLITENKHKALIHEEMLFAESDDENSNLELNKQTAMEEAEPQIKTEPSDIEAFESESTAKLLDSEESKSGTVNGDIPVKLEISIPHLQKKLTPSGSPKNAKLASSDMNQKKKRRKLASNCITDSDDEVPEGWKRLVVQRQGGASAGKYDVYYISPLGKRLRSRVEVTSYCAKHGIAIDINCFKFAHGPPKQSISQNSSTTIRAAKKPEKNALGSKRKLPDDEKESGNSSAKRPKLSASSRKKTLPSDKSLVSKSKEIKVDPENLKKKGAAPSPKKPSRLHLKGKTSWMPPKSPFNMYQESLHHDPWQLLIGTIFLNKSSGDDELARNILWEFVEKWPTPESLLAAEQADIIDVIKPLGLHEKRVKMLYQFSDEYIKKNWTYPKDLHGIGKYGNDCYRIFCVNEWRKVKPTDYLLIFYVDWLWDNHAFLNLD